MEDIRPDEGAVLKTAGVNALRGSSPVWVAKKFELRSSKFENSHFEIPASNFIWCGTPTAERLVLGTSVCGFESHLHHCEYVCEV